MTKVELAEWQQATPETVPALRGISFASDLRDLELLDHLERQRMITVREFRDGIGITTTSFVVPSARDVTNESSEWTCS